MNFDLFLMKLLNGSDSLFLDHFAVCLTQGYTWIPLYVALGVLIIKNNKTMPQIILIFFCGILGVMLSGVFSDLIVKPFFQRPRPCYDMEFMHLIKTVPGYSAKGFSFFSSHAANTMSLAVFFMLLVRNRILSLALMAWTLVNAWTRIYLGVHWPADVLAGMGWGMCTGMLMYYLYYKIFYKISPHVNYVSTHYTRTGYCNTDVDICLSVIMLTVLFAFIHAAVA